VQCSLSALDQPLSLSGDWEFQVDPTGKLDVASIRPDRIIRVPQPWQAAFPDLRRYSGYAFASASIQADLVAGRVVGWVHHPTAHTVHFRYGRGRVVMTTFRLRDSFGRDPIATEMVHDLLDLLADDQVVPTLTAQGLPPTNDTRRLP